jgi:hypothetical protein
MSGGELNYIYEKVNDSADTILQKSKNSIHIAFANHLKKVAIALHDIEWVLSGDTSSPNEEPAIRTCITPSDELNSSREEAEEALKNLSQAMERLKL